MKISDINKISRISFKIMLFIALTSFLTIFVDAGGSCFLSGTLITLGNGSQLPIEKVKVGDKITSYDKNLNPVLSEVLETEAPVRDGYYIITFENGKELKVTNEHPLYIKSVGYEGWGSIIPQETLDDANIKTKKIEVGDFILNIEKKWIKIIEIKYINKKVQTYNLKKVDKTNTFFAEGFLAHNKGNPPPPPPPPPPCIIKDSGCYKIGDVKAAPGEIAPEDFGYFLPQNQCISTGSCDCRGIPSNVDKQNNPDDSSNACNCVIGTDWNSKGKCCGDDTEDCANIVEGNLCKVDTKSQSSNWLNANDNAGDIWYVPCSKLEYVSNGNVWTKCQPPPHWTKLISDHDYKCTGKGRKSIVECCGDAACNSKTDGKRLATGQSINGSSGSTPHFQESLTGNSIYDSGLKSITGRQVQTCGNGVCDGGNLESCTNCPSDCGACNSNAFVSVSCKNNQPKIVLSYDTCSSGADEWQIYPSGIQFDTSQGYLIDNGQCKQAVEWSSDIPRNIVNGPSNSIPLAKHTYAWDVSVRNVHNNPIVTGVLKTSDCIPVIPPAPILTISPSIVIKGKDSIKWTLTNATPNSDISVFQTIDGEIDLEDSIIGKTDASGFWNTTIADTSEYKTGFYTTFVEVNKTKSNTVEWEVIAPENDTNNIFYCRSDSKFVTDLDTPESKSTCEKAGFVWTGTLCCSEADDRHEYYNDPEGTGGCWDKKYIQSVSFVNNTQDSVINYNGTFHGCVIDAKRFNTANDALLNISDSHTGQQLITNDPYCFVEPEGVYYCSFKEKWLPTYGVTDLHLSYAPIVNLSENPLNISLPAQCCPTGKCWDGNNCTENQRGKPLGQPIVDSLRCIDGNWVKSTLKYTPDGLLSGYCLKDSQCLIDPFAKTESEQCIETGKFVGDNYCNNGEWVTRTNFLISTLLELKDNDFSLFCDNKDNVLNYFQYKTSSGELASNVLNRLKVNNICILKNSNNVVIGLTLNQNANNISSKDWALFKLQNCDSAIKNTDGNYHTCSSSNKVWFNRNSMGIIYSGSPIKVPNICIEGSQSCDPLNLYQTLVKNPVDDIIAIIQGLIVVPPIDDSYVTGFTKLNRIFLQSHQGKEVIGAIDGVQFKNLIVHYKSFDTDICKSIKDFNTAYGLNSSGIVCINDNNDYYLLAQGDSLVNFNPDAIWQDVTSKLRIK